MRAGGAEGDPEGDGRRTLVNGWESRLWRLEDKHLREGSSVRQFGRPRPLRIRHRRREGQLTQKIHNTLVSDIETGLDYNWLKVHTVIRSFQILILHKRLNSIMNH